MSIPASKKQTGDLTYQKQQMIAANVTYHGGCAANVHVAKLAGGQRWSNGGNRAVSVSNLGPAENKQEAGGNMRESTVLVNFVIMVGFGEEAKRRLYHSYKIIWQIG